MTDLSQGTPDAFDDLRKVEIALAQRDDAERRAAKWLAENIALGERLQAAEEKLAALSSPQSEPQRSPVENVSKGDLQAFIYTRSPATSGEMASQIIDTFNVTRRSPAASNTERQDG